VSHREAARYFAQGKGWTPASACTEAGRVFGDVHCGDPRPSSEKLRFLADVSRLLRLMDGLIVGNETAEGFVSKFSAAFLQVTAWDLDAALDRSFDRLNDFYTKIQRFSNSSQARAEEPLLFGPDELRDRTQIAYAELKSAFAGALMQRQGL
jgi:hypothetical protein